jgi:HD-GYP domain-containing protein (c-di-GMP phosphodiesterase class II)
VVLAEEFGTPFRFYDAIGCQEVSPPEAAAEADAPLDPAEVQRLAAEGRCAVDALADGRHRLALVVFEAAVPILVAVGAVEGLAAEGPARARERGRLLKWLQTFGDRLRLRDQLAEHRRLEAEQAEQIKRAWEVVLGVDEAIRALRTHKEAEKHRRGVLRSALAVLGAETLAWVPEDGAAEVLAEGAPCLAPPDCRQLAALLTRTPDLPPGKPVLWNEGQSALWAARFAAVSNLLAFRVTDPQGAGWLIAVNKRAAGGPPGPEGRGPFRLTDAAVLTPFAALLELHGRASRRYRDLKELLVGLTRSLTAALDAKDTYTFGHSERVARIAVELGRELGLPEDELSDIYLAGLLHDIGKIGVRDSVLRKAEPLTPEEVEELRKHVVVGHSILSDLRQVRNLLPGVLHHHERVDGTGYPSGLAGEAIPLLARVLAVADAYDAMSTRRPYREAMPWRQVEATLEAGAGTQWDARVIDAFRRCRERIHIIRQRGVGESLYHALDGALREPGSSSLLLRDRVIELSR